MASHMPTCLGRLAWVLLAALAVVVGTCSGKASPLKHPKLKLAVSSGVQAPASRRAGLRRQTKAK